MGYLAGVPRRFLVKFPGWVKTVDVRRAQKEKEERGVHSLQWWSDFTLRLTDLTTVSFAALMDSACEALGVHCRCVQRRQLSASEREASSQQLRGALENMEASAESVIRFIDVVSFLPGYLPDRDLYRFVLVWSCHRWSRAFPLLPLRMTSALFTGLVGGTDVLLDLPADDPSNEWQRVHAACQCGSEVRGRRNREVLEIRGLRWGVPRLVEGREGGIRDVLDIRVPIMVPRWVARHRLMSLSNDVGTNGSGPPTRTYYGERMRQPVKKICRARRKFLWAAMKIRRALIEFGVFGANLRKEVDHYEGLGGREAATIHLSEHVSTCFDPAVMCDPSNNAGPRGLSEVYRVLRAELEHTAWPDWPWVERSWPDTQGLVGQYDTLRRRLQPISVAHQVALGSGNYAERGWYDAGGYWVVDLCALRDLMSTLCVAARRCFADSQVLCRVASYSHSRFVCTRTRLSAVRRQASVRSMLPEELARRCVFPEQVWAPGSVCWFRASPSTRAGRLVLVVAIRPEGSHSEFARRMESSVELTRDCWHVARLWHRCKIIFNDSEARAEAWAGSLSALWDPVSGLSTKSIVTRLQLKTAGLQGNGDDDVVVQSAWGFISSDLQRGGCALDRRCSGPGRRGAWPCFSLADTQRVRPEDVGTKARTVYDLYLHVRKLRRRSDIGRLSTDDLRVMKEKCADRALRVMPVGKAGRIRLSQMAWSERRRTFAKWQTSAVPRSAPSKLKRVRKRKTLYLSARARPGVVS